LITSTGRYYDPPERLLYSDPKMCDCGNPGAVWPSGFPKLTDGEHSPICDRCLRLESERRLLEAANNGARQSPRRVRVYE
jgi:hypothetical protein